MVRLRRMKMPLAIAGGAALCLLAAACGSVRADSAVTAHADKGGSAALASGHDLVTEAGNRKLAVAEAQRLLSMVPVPDHSVPLRSAPPELPSPAMGTPGVSSLVDSIRSWRLAMPFTAAEEWLAEHGPAGLRQDGEDLPYGPPASGYSYAGPANAAWDSAELDIEVAPANDGASVVMRADALVVWLDPVPVRDTARGKRLRVLAGAGCPAADAGVVGVANPDRDLAHRLVPAGRPRTGLECVYYGMNGLPWQLRRQQHLTAAQAQRVAASMARLPLSHPLGAELSCLMDDGSAELIALSYPGRPDVDLWVLLNGCGGVSNGYIFAGQP
jgi:hypothetical protein